MKGLVFGYFDILHPGHIHFLREARAILQSCESSAPGPSQPHLVVGLGGDNSIRWQKGSDRPYMNQSDRKIMLESCRYVDEVVLHEPMLHEEDTDQNGHDFVFEQVNPDLFIHSRQTPHTHLLTLIRKYDILSTYVDSLPIHTSDLVSKWRRFESAIPNRYMPGTI